ASSGSLAETGISKEKVNINTAGAEALMTLRGIGEARAGDIIAYRKKHGPFEKIEDIMQVPGIKDAAFQKIKEDITV
ncbi:MAG: helix-hairpin-helix domain-containing protein, partial [Lachnospiraceae bacterium]|nr:helix-hairpin-helix domain-containing protein [Lachnospiraceae bacterium]